MCEHRSTCMDWHCLELFRTTVSWWCCLYRRSDEQLPITCMLRVISNLKFHVCVVVSTCLIPRGRYQNVPKQYFIKLHVWYSILQWSTLPSKVQINPIHLEAQVEYGSRNWSPNPRMMGSALAIDWVEPPALIASHTLHHLYILPVISRRPGHDHKIWGVGGVGRILIAVGIFQFPSVRRTMAGDGLKWDGLLKWSLSHADGTRPPRNLRYYYIDPFALYRPSPFPRVLMTLEELLLHNLAKMSIHVRGRCSWFWFVYWLVARRIGSGSWKRCKRRPSTWLSEWRRLLLSWKPRRMFWRRRESSRRIS